MKNNIQEVKEHYNKNPKIEWDRLQKKHPYEKYITIKIMDKYIKDGDSILDNGAITQAQHDKSQRDLTVKMGYREIKPNSSGR